MSGLALLLVEDEEEDCSMSSWSRFLDITLLLVDDEECFLNSRFFQWYALQCDTDGTEAEARNGTAKTKTFFDLLRG